MTTETVGRIEQSPEAMDMSHRTIESNNEQETGMSNHVATIEVHNFLGKSMKAHNQFGAYHGASIEAALLHGCGLLRRHPLLPLKIPRDATSRRDAEMEGNDPHPCNNADAVVDVYCRLREGRMGSSQ